MNTVEVDLWKGDWGLASVDVDCLEVLTYIKFLGVPLRITESSNPFFSPNGKFPVVRDGSKTLTTLDEVITHFKGHGMSADEWLSSEGSAEAAAYRAYVQHKVRPALAYLLWAHENNYRNVTRPAYARSLCAPFSWWYPARYRRQALALLEATVPGGAAGPAGEGPPPDLAEAGADLVADATRSLGAMAARLADRDFLLGNRPCSADAALYAALAVWGGAGVGGGAGAAGGVWARYVARISSQYHHASCAAGTGHAHRGTFAGSAPPPPPRTALFAALFAATAMAGFAFANGLFQIQWSEGEASMLFDEDNDVEDD